MRSRVLERLKIRFLRERVVALSRVSHADTRSRLLSKGCSHTEGERRRWKNACWRWMSENGTRRRAEEEKRSSTLREETMFNTSNHGLTRWLSPTGSLLSNRLQLLCNSVWYVTCRACTHTRWSNSAATNRCYNWPQLFQQSSSPHSVAEEKDQKILHHTRPWVYSSETRR